MTDDRMARLRRLLAETHTPEEIDAWMTTRHRELGNRRPIDVVMAGGIHSVLIAARVERATVDLPETAGEL